LIDGIDLLKIVFLGLENFIDALNDRFWPLAEVNFSGFWGV
jgi:hypothetical protein